MGLRTSAFIISVNFLWSSAFCPTLSAVFRIYGSLWNTASLRMEERGTCSGRGLIEFSLLSWKRAQPTHLHLADENVEAQRGGVTYPQSPSWLVTESGWGSGTWPLTPRALPVEAVPLRCSCLNVPYEAGHRLSAGEGGALRTPRQPEHSIGPMLRPLLPRSLWSAGATWGRHERIRKLMSLFAYPEDNSPARLCVQILSAKQPSHHVPHSDQPKSSPCSQHLALQVPRWLQPKSSLGLDTAVALAVCFCTTVNYLNRLRWQFYEPGTYALRKFVYALSGTRHLSSRRVEPILCVGVPTCDIESICLHRFFLSVDVSVAKPCTCRFWKALNLSRCCV